MSVRHKPVGWNRSKKLYDAVLLAGTAAYLLCSPTFGSARASSG